MSVKNSVPSGKTVRRIWAATQRAAREKQVQAPALPTNWNDYAAQFKKCFVRYEHVQSQATRYEPSRELSHQWVLFLPSPCVIPTVACKTIDECRTVAAQYGCTIIL